MSEIFWILYFSSEQLLMFTLAALILETLKIYITKNITTV